MNRDKSDGVIVKRGFKEIRSCILLSLSKGQKTVNQISNDMLINWKTVDNHLIFLLGKRLVKEVFVSSYVKIYELTAFGKDHLRRHVNKDIAILDNKLIEKVKDNNIPYIKGVRKP
jgi:predicted transcriptional regulator